MQVPAQEQADGTTSVAISSQAEILPAADSASTANKTSSKYFEALARAHGVLEEVVEVRERKIVPSRKPAPPKRPLTEQEIKINSKFAKVFPGQFIGHNVYMSKKL